MKKKEETNGNKLTSKKHEKRSDQNPDTAQVQHSSPRKDGPRAQGAPALHDPPVPPLPFPRRSHIMQPVVGLLRVPCARVGLHDSRRNGREVVARLRVLSARRRARSKGTSSVVLFRIKMLSRRSLQKKKATSGPSVRLAPRAIQETGKPIITNAPIQHDPRASRWQSRIPSHHARH